MLKDKKILIIAPHPDDEAICSGGLIMLAKNNGAIVHVLFMTIGTSRQFSAVETSANIRIPEAKKAAKYGNFSYKIAYEGKEFMRLDTVPQKDIIEIIEDTSHSFKPDIVCVPNRYSFDQDHRAVSLACITAFRPLPQSFRHQAKIILECEEPYTWTTEESFKPNFYFDISNVMGEKISLLKCHKTQLRHDPFPRSPENLRRLAGMRGCDISVEYAEGYNLLKGQFV